MYTISINLPFYTFYTFYLYTLKIEVCTVNKGNQIVLYNYYFAIYIYTNLQFFYVIVTYHDRLFNKRIIGIPITYTDNYPYLFTLIFNHCSGQYI